MDENIIQAQPSVIPPTSQTTPPVQPPKGKKSLVFMIAIHIIAVAVTGFFVYKNIQLKKQISLPQPTPVASITPTLLPTIDPTASWKTYTNNTIKLTFKYPSDWSMKPLKITTTYPLYGIAELYPPNFDNLQPGGFITISYWDNPENLTLQEMENKYKREMGQPQFLFSGGVSSEFQGFSAYTGNHVQACEPFICDKVIINTGKNIFIVDNIYSQTSSNEDVYKQILSTFKFTD